MENILRKRIQVFLFEYFICSLLALIFLARSGLPSVFSIIYAWLLSHFGHFTQYMVAPYLMTEDVGQWVLFATFVVLNIAGVLIYFIRPNIVTAGLSLLSIAIWFFYGVHGVLIGV